jgi:hypothetical protein
MTFKEGSLAFLRHQYGSIQLIPFKPGILITADVNKEKENGTNFPSILPSLAPR